MITLISRFALTFGFLLLLSTSSSAAVHVINFGGAHGELYTPNNLFLTTNDIIQFEGDFEKYPLAFLEVPPGAEDPGELRHGTVYVYRVAVGGHYSFHSPAAGFRGAFSAIDERIDVQRQEAIQLAIYPNPAVQGFCIKGDEAEAVTGLQLIASDGKRHQLSFSLADGEIAADISRLDLRGVFLLDIISRERRYFRKLVIDR